MGIVKIENLTHDYVDEEEKTKIRAIDGVSMDVNRGEFIAIIGHNGSGKSSLAKHINALLFPTEGTVWVDGLGTGDEKNTWDIRQRAGMVFQNPDNQIVSTVVEEDVAFGPENLSVPTDEIWERVDYALSAVHMTKYREKSPLRLSGGQKQRVAIAGIIAMQPKCIILDEPTAMLDPTGRNEVIDTLRELNKEKGITIILITHHMDEAVDVDKVFVMDKGRLVMSGTPKEVFSKADEIKSYGLEMPQVTELGHLLKEGGLDVEDGILTLEELIEQIDRARNKNGIRG